MKSTTSSLNSLVSASSSSFNTIPTSTGHENDENDEFMSDAKVNNPDETDEEVSLENSNSKSKTASKKLNGSSSKKPLLSRPGKRAKTAKSKQSRRSQQNKPKTGVVATSPTNLTDGDTIKTKKATKSNIKKLQSSRLKRSVLVNINSNLWGTRFRFVGQRYLPAFTGQIVYKTSLFHLQPRQMTITLEDLTNLCSKNKQTKTVAVAVASPVKPAQKLKVDMPKKKAVSVTNVTSQTSNEPALLSLPKSATATSIIPLSFKQKLNNYTKLAAIDTSTSTAVVGGGVGARSSMASASLLDMNYFMKLRLAASSYAKLNATELSTSTSSLVDLDQIRSNCHGATELVDAQFNKLNSQAGEHAASSLSTLTASSDSSSISNSSNSVACSQAEATPTTAAAEFNLPKLALSTTNSLYESFYDDEKHIEAGCYLITSSTKGEVFSSNNNDSEPLLVNPVVVENHHAIYTPPKMTYTAASTKSRHHQSSTKFTTRIDLILNYLKSRKQLQFLFENGGLAAASENTDRLEQPELKLANPPVNNSNTNQEECSVNLEIVRSGENEKNSDYEDIDESSLIMNTTGGEQLETTTTTANEVDKKVDKKSGLGLLGKRNNLMKTLRKKNGSVKNPDTSTAAAATAAAVSSKNKVFCKSSDNTNHIVLHNKPPIWNETSQVYQLDFGGRVTQESAKNFQIEHNGRQVMQFGRIDTNAYTLDFQWPFSTVQAFSIALANITQRLK